MEGTSEGEGEEGREGEGEVEGEGGGVRGRGEDLMLENHTSNRDAAKARPLFSQQDVKLRHIVGMQHSGCISRIFSFPTIEQNTLALVRV
jgi:hypothetical protein